MFHSLSQSCANVQWSQGGSVAIGISALDVLILPTDLPFNYTKGKSQVFRTVTLFKVRFNSTCFSLRQSTLTTLFFFFFFYCMMSGCFERTVTLYMFLDSVASQDRSIVCSLFSSKPVILININQKFSHKSAVMNKTSNSSLF